MFKIQVTSQNRPKRLKTWKMWEPNRPAPFVVFEIAAADTWRLDLREKPEKYRQLGVNEYFAYDPSVPTLLARW